MPNDFLTAEEYACLQAKHKLPELPENAMKVRVFLPWDRVTYSVVNEKGVECKFLQVIGINLPPMPVSQQYTSSLG